MPFLFLSLCSFVNEANYFQLVFLKYCLHKTGFVGVLNFMTLEKPEINTEIIILNALVILAILHTTKYRVHHST